MFSCKNFINGMKIFKFYEGGTRFDEGEIVGISLIAK